MTAHTHECPHCGCRETCDDGCTVMHRDGVTSFPVACSTCLARRDHARRVLARRPAVADGPELAADLGDAGRSRPHGWATLTELASRLHGSDDRSSAWTATRRRLGSYASMLGLHDASTNNRRTVGGRTFYSPGALGLIRREWISRGRP